MARVYAVISLCAVLIFGLTGCTEEKEEIITINIEETSAINHNVVGTGALKEIGGNLYYDVTTGIVYFWYGDDDYAPSHTTPSPYYAPNGLPYKYNPATNTLEEIK